MAFRGAIAVVTLLLLAGCGGGSISSAPSDCANPSSVTNQTSAPTSALNTDWTNAVHDIAAGNWCTDVTCKAMGAAIPQAASMPPNCTVVKAVPDNGTNAFLFQGQWVHGYTDVGKNPCAVYVAASQVVEDATYEMQNCALIRLGQDVSKR